MTDAAFVVKDTGTSGSGNWVSSSKYATCSPIPAVDPEIQLNTDKTASTPFVRGDGHLLITLPPWGGKWDEKSYQRLQLERQYDVDILCGHFLRYVQGSMDLNIYRQIGLGIQRYSR